MEPNKIITNLKQTPQQILESRRKFLKVATFLGLSIFLKDKLLADNNKYHDINNRWLYLYNNNTGESYKELYFYNGFYEDESYIKFSKFLRDSHNGKVIPIDYHLQDALWFVQSILWEYGYKEVIHINSGYRSKETNAKIEGAAKDSYHMYGKAIDFYYPKMGIDKLGKLVTIALNQKAGIGYYVNKVNTPFIHCDTGIQRTWFR